MLLLPTLRFTFFNLLRPPSSQNIHSLHASPRLLGVLNWALKLRPCSSFSAAAGDGDRGRTYQVVVAATRDMGIGKDGKLPWKLPSDLKFFKELTTTTLDPTKKNVVLMGRKTWESIPFEFRPLPGRVNVVLTRSGSVDDDSVAGKVVVYDSISSALESLAQPPYSQSIEKVFVIGGGQLLREALNAPECDAIHITEIETSIDCDTFIPPIDLSLFQLWYSSQPLVENNIRFSFATYVRVRSSTIISKFKVDSFSFLPKMIVERHDENSYLKLVQEFISSVSQKDDETDNGTLSRPGCEMQFNLRKSFPLLTTKQVLWDGVIQELFRLITVSTKAKLTKIIDEIKNIPDDEQISLSVPSDLILAKFHVANGELSCQTHQPSADIFLAVPLNIASYALLTYTIAHVCGLIPGSFIYIIGDAHVNRTHIRTLQEQLHKLPKPFPILKINPKKKDLDAFMTADFELMGYDPHS